MARKEELPIVEEVRKEAHDDGLLDQHYKDMKKGHIAQSIRNTEKSLERLKHLSR
jgi:hypothetical protein